jgi:lysophospholipid acyltransferase (LPLAT)-like uncharacterized protein
MRSWDGFRIPRPFTKVVVGYGEPVRVPPELDQADIETWCDRIGREIAGVTSDVARRVGEAD